MPNCRVPGCTQHYGCRLRAKGIQIDPRATPTQRNQVGPPEANPWWERQVIGETRVDGSFMPFLVDDMTRPLQIKQYSENRHKIDDQIRAARQGAP
jgi:hypothetical protein